MRHFCTAVGEDGAGAGDDLTQNLEKPMVFHRFGGCGVFLLVALCRRSTKLAGMTNSGYRNLTGGSSEFHAVPAVRKSSKTHQKTPKSGKVSRGRVRGGIVDPPSTGPLPPPSPAWSTIPSPSPLPLSRLRRFPSSSPAPAPAPSQLAQASSSSNQLQLRSSWLQPAPANSTQGTAAQQGCRTPKSWLKPALAPASCSFQIAGFSQLQLTVRKAPQRSKDATPQSQYVRPPTYLKNAVQ